uniref:Alanyl-transfer RNA synthetases family profile domain-containing protein n=1 Tax=Trieres chinensis TaxID=1514140 RepID=A0A7S2EUI9_TRICV|mmetsp:Transcript_38368/g.78277  ORF Transcript_38368/g.78277 Transcript_38368/m.78277 type:complete len:272 (+) Transcript_38368:58-873(+)|eukprot:CAMPEP_0183294452 /NCGR_PEP_ID=MMETSP0160_2-20130417/2792_1 /TAXON_ID=2839 ORGANISM="Odontella Sinensis, Strain Grunow 1884" /NCGR_SAMPLE_ID=MMETSP0160_2 /ASSEMBLY_ACC=CAM_ASM_000250 /LENGTH=271 /DNA_ID=CAMNT_0025455785 /DNA_START=35 /DNA_END=850 /DNA_ORIENTATION=+
MTTTETPTELIHLTYEGNFQLECEATVLSCRLLGEDANGGKTGVEIILDRTVMHPQGGGQPSDHGRVASGEVGFDVDFVSIDRETCVVRHTGKILESLDGSPPFRPGDTVAVTVDADRRRAMSECHTAGHVIDRAMDRVGKTLPPTKGYHFLDGPYVEYKGTIPAPDRPEFLASLQEAFLALIDENIPTAIETLPRHEAEEKCTRLASNFDFRSMVAEDVTEVRVVTAAEWSCPCGGTHLRNTGELKERGWEVRGLKCKKGVIRVRYGPKE